MGKWQKWVNILEKNPNKTVRNLAKEFNKNYTWVHFLKAFYNATTEEKEKLKDTHAQYKYFYKVWKQETNTIQDANIHTEEDNNLNNSKSGNTLPIIPYYKIKDLKEVIKYLTLGNKRLIEENNSFAEDNLFKAKNINQLINKNNKLEEELKITKYKLKITKYEYWGALGAAILFIIIGVMRCSG